MERDTILCLCDLTGIMAQPWMNAGYRAILVDPQHGTTRAEGNVLKLACTVKEAMPQISTLIHDRRLCFVAAFPPCTDLAVSGARWFTRKYTVDHLFQARATMVAEQCRTIGLLSGAPFFVENPVSVLSSLWGKPDYTFHPYYYTSYCGEDNYFKRTCLWTGNNFIMPETRVDPTLPSPDTRIHTMPPGPERANQRSATPLGFSRAVYNVNHSENQIIERILR